MNPRRLYRSRDRQLAGVAGGMADYLDVDPTVIRIGWILVTVVTGGLALIAYLLLALVIPMSPSAAGSYWTGQPAPTTGWADAPGPTGAPGSPAGWSGGPGYGGQGWQTPPTAFGWQPAGLPARPESRGLGAAGIVGVVLVVIGALALTDVVVPGIHAGAVIGPAILLALGCALVVSSVRRRVDDVAAPAAATPAATQPVPAPLDPTSSGPA